MGMRERRRMRAARHQTGEMRHVHEQISADRIGDGAKTREIPVAGIGRAAGDDQLGLVRDSQRLDLVHVDAARLAADAIADRLEPFARHIDRRTMGEMAARRQIETHEDIARLKQGEEDRLVGLAAGIGLHIGVAAAKKLCDALDGEVFGDVHELAAAIIAFSRIALGVFIGQHRALRFEHGA